MTSRRARPTFDDVLEAVGSLSEQIQVLVSAVDDLRCEVEWQARNSAVAESVAAPPLDRPAPGEEESTPRSTTGEIAADSLLTASGRLRACERLYSQGLRERWSDEWTDRDDFEIPVGKIISVDADMWSSVLDIRPAHIIGEGCCCEAGIGAPYLLAWQSGEEFLLRELTDEQAYRLQELCLADQAEHTEAAKKRLYEVPAATQQGLF